MGKRGPCMPVATCNGCGPRPSAAPGYARINLGRHDDCYTRIRSGPVLTSINTENKGVKPTSAGGAHELSQGQLLPDPVPQEADQPLYNGTGGLAIAPEIAASSHHSRASLHKVRLAVVACCCLVHAPPCMHHHACTIPSSPSCTCLPCRKIST